MRSPSSISRLPFRQRASSPRRAPKWEVRETKGMGRREGEMNLLLDLPKVEDFEGGNLVDEI